MKNVLPFLLLALLFTRCQNNGSNATPTATKSDSPAATTASPVMPATALADTAQLIGVMQKSAADWNKGDLAAFMDSYDDSATMMSKHGLIKKDTMMVHYRQTYFKAGAPLQKLGFDQFQIIPLSGDYVLLTGRFTLSGGNLPLLSGRYSLVCVHRKNGWKILHDHTS